MEKKMTITYEVGSKLYMNITNKCPCSCTFCIRNNSDGAYGSDSLWLEHEPSFEEICNALDNRDIPSYSEIVFCGYGEPTNRLDTLIKTANYLKNIENCPPLRLNTNGLSDLINNKDTSKIIGDVFNIISVSLNAGTKDEYMKVTRPKFEDAFEAMQKFTENCTKTSAQIIMTVVDVIGELEITKAEEVCKKTGATFRVRPLET